MRAPEQPDVGRVRAEILRLIECRKLGTDGRLPTERALAKQLKASRWTVRRSLTLLEAEGRIWRHVGRGTFVGTRPDEAGTAFQSMARDLNPMELVDARIAVEPELARRAALQASQSRISAIAHAANRCAKARNFAEYEIWDEAFHREVAGAGGNSVLKAVFEALNGLRKEVVWGTLRKSILRPEVRRFFSGQHDEVVAAIADRDPHRAAEAMATHLRSLEQTYASVAEVRGNGGQSPQFGPNPEDIRRHD